MSNRPTKRLEETGDGFLSQPRNTFMAAGVLILGTLAAGYHAGLLNELYDTPNEALGFATTEEQLADSEGPKATQEDLDVAQNIEETRVSAEENITDIKHRAAAENQINEK